MYRLKPIILLGFGCLSLILSNSVNAYRVYYDESAFPINIDDPVTGYPYPYLFECRHYGYSQYCNRFEAIYPKDPYLYRQN
jgi:hypothetical protein